MATITSAGIGSGLDIESLIGSLVAAERTPIKLLQQRTEGLKTQLSAYGKLQSAFAALRDASQKLTRPDTWNASVASSSDPSSIAVSTGGSISPGSVTVSVGTLASAQTTSSRALASSSTVLGNGSLTIELGAWNADQTAFTPKSGVSAVNIDILPGEDSLTQVRDKINAAGAGVVASVVNDAGGSRLVLRSSSTGETNAFRVTVSDNDGNSSDDQGLSALAYDPSAGLNSMSRNQVAANAQAMLNGIPINSETNTLKDAIDGLNITLLKTTAADVTLNVAQDKDAIKKAIEEFSTAYNAVISLMREQSKYDAGSKAAGTLQGDSTLISLQGRLRSLAASSTTLGGSLGRLADIGLDPKTDGSFKINTSKLDKALGNLDDLKSFFMSVDNGNAANSGLAQQLRSFADSILGSDGSLSNRQKGLQSRIDANGDREASMEDRILLTEKRLRARYTALDTQMSALSGLSSYVSQQMALLNKG